MAVCYIAVGSNLGKRRENIQSALRLLGQDSAVQILKVSSLIETVPEHCPSQPNFLNGVIKLETLYSAQKLLGCLQDIELSLGRQKSRPKNQPRTIDLDILLYADEKIDNQDLVVPHPRMWQRRFVTEPLREIAPELFAK